MKKPLLIGGLTLLTKAALLAQSTGVLVATADTRHAKLDGLVDQLEQYAVLTLLGMVLLLGTVWLAFIWKFAIQTTGKSKSTSTAVVAFLAVASVSTLGSGCSMVQMIHAAETQKARVKEGAWCACPQSSRPYNSFPGAIQPYPAKNFDYGSGMPYCKKCSGRINYCNQ